MAKLESKMREFLVKHIGEQKVRFIEASSKDLKDAMRALGYSITDKSNIGGQKGVNDYLDFIDLERLTGTTDNWISDVFGLR